jgi:hypothetical protein
MKRKMVWLYEDKKGQFYSEAAESPEPTRRVRVAIYR